VSPKRGDDIAPPTLPGEWKLRYASSEAVSGWSDLCGKAPGNTLRAYEAIRTQPRPAVPSSRHARLKYDLATVTRNGVKLEHWQYEVTGGGRIWYHIEDSSLTVWVDYAGVGHPKQTD
jgi:hypothetical protein